MRDIVADTRWAGDHGIGRYGREILHRLAHVPLRVGGRPMDPLDPIRLSVALREQGRGRIFFSPGYNGPLYATEPYVFSIHDLNHIDRTENANKLKSLYYAAFMRPACRRADVVFTVSEFSRQRIVEWAGVPEDRVVIVGNGVNPAFCPEGPRHIRDRPYFLCVSNRRLHKNEPRVVAALAGAAVDDAGLVFSGFPTPQLQALIDSHGLGRRVTFAGPVNDAALASLYRGAIATLFPSLYEGFGLPVIESMACGTPVLTSNTTALPELAAAAALLVDPESTDAIAGGITRLYQDGELRLQLRAAGLARARAFTWSDVATRARYALERIG